MEKKQLIPIYWLKSNLLLIIFFVFSQAIFGVDSDDLAVTFDKPAEIEVGGPYAGVEFHHSYMIPQRIGFFYPVANTIDFSTDNWTRDTSFVAEWFLKIGNGPRESLGREPAKIKLTPYSVEFFDNKPRYDFNVTYRFCYEKPAMVVTYEIVNRLKKNEVFEFDTRLFTSIRTSHSYRREDHAIIRNDSDGMTVYTNYPGGDTRFAQVFVTNAGERPLAIPLEKTGKPNTHFVYRRELQPGDVLRVIQIIGSANENEGPSIVDYLKENYEQEIAKYESSVLEEAIKASRFQTGDKQIDHSVVWAKAVMAANAHYMNGEIVPIPCPGTYNLFFTYDIVVSDRAAVKFDLNRVKYNLDYIIRHANRYNIIPHAYYWKDFAFRAEYSGHNNWNTEFDATILWFIQLAASYLRYSGDTEFIEKAYPFISAGLDQALSTKEDDNLMWSYRAGGDIGHNYGPRTHLTVVAIKSLRDYNYIATVLGKDPERVSGYAALADAMQVALVEKLWNADMAYLINYYNDGSLDEHYYTNSLLAARYGLLDVEKRNQLIKSAQDKLLDENLGLYCVFPMDLEQMGDVWKFIGSEAGPKYYYANGGIWAPGNAYYALALIANGERQLAAEFINRTMSLSGIMNGPNGQPAYYEYRTGNKEDPNEYGIIRKPQILWGATWYLDCLYNMYGVMENDWNVGLDPFLPDGQEKCRFTLCVNGQPLVVNIEGSGETIQSIKYDGQAVHSAIFPVDMPAVKEVEFILGVSKEPYLKSTNAILHRCEYEKKQLSISLGGYVSLKNETVVISPHKPTSVSLNDRTLSDGWITVKEETGYKTTIHFKHDTSNDKFVIKF